jgi:hypothetical protein
MELWYPPKDRPHLLEWWRPLMLASRAARLAEVPWPIHLDELVLVGRVDRASRPAIWVYRHPANDGELYLDSTGQAYEFHRTPRAKAYGRFTACSVDRAIWRARLPDVVEPIWYHPERASRAWEPPATTPDAAAPEAGGAPEAPEAPAAPAPRTRGHLTVYDGGQSLAG